jgi:hypothetical protein
VGDVGDGVPVMQALPGIEVWSAVYPPIGGPDAVATINAIEGGGFSISVVAVGWAVKQHSGPALASTEKTLSETRAHADRMAVELLGREVAAAWRGPLGEFLR